ncbi:Hsp33 family molecular chaperone HslO [Ectothiorhodospira variabilis]|uniref:Hsp33 family molecular chaperone HslO n=1 Tax=Ectothiorhodospira variabilis TaxID=505694 RepID=UPI001EFB0872|nr:Hsp33 family molecular chaperone HslO [Ectothiorhodospira variabilis]MCG5495631.1 Hsp33 family molecular chaperone HslO [Ectothiorhodospira variabilis]MCG5498836.1 Hsp33 family molecular chaperone HslO [Ectothiorhodospira variabilis]MCG5504692.1 Hsp33 family molecular chaperone HslO [Ectothiorhodospira variabilis]MCG5507849.1 Hsp33 family molecular chaperone HslO [Ectothiorhodospira variabilis]
MSQDQLQRFLLEDLDIRGAVVRLGPVWQQVMAEREYPFPATELLGEMCATALLISESLKQPGRITFQLKGDGPISLLVVDCDERLNLRAMAQTEPRIEPAPAPQLLGDGQLLLSLDMPTMRQPWQSVVPMQGERIASMFEHYLGLSDQLPSRLFLAATRTGVAGLLLQKLPEADARDPDGWNRVEQLASTVTPQEQIELPAQNLLTRLFPEETVRVFEPRRVIHDAPEDWTKVRNMLRSLGREQVESVLSEQGEVVIRDDLANREYRLDAAAVAALFDESPPTLH